MRLVIALAVLMGIDSVAWFVADATGANGLGFCLIPGRLVGLACLLLLLAGAGNGEENLAGIGDFCGVLDVLGVHGVSSMLYVGERGVLGTVSEGIAGLLYLLTCWAANGIGIFFISAILIMLRRSLYLGHSLLLSE